MHKPISGLKSGQHFSSKMTFPLIAQPKGHCMFKVWWQGNYSIHFGKNKTKQLFWEAILMAKYI